MSFQSNGLRLNLSLPIVRLIISLIFFITSWSLDITPLNAFSTTGAAGCAAVRQAENYCNRKGRAGDMVRAGCATTCAICPSVCRTGTAGTATLASPGQCARCAAGRSAASGATACAPCPSCLTSAAGAASCAVRAPMVPDKGVSGAPPCAKLKNCCSRKDNTVRHALPVCPRNRRPVN